MDDEEARRIAAENSALARLYYGDGSRAPLMFHGLAARYAIPDDGVAYTRLDRLRGWLSRRLEDIAYWVSP